MAGLWLRKVRRPGPTVCITYWTSWRLATSPALTSIVTRTAKNGRPCGTAEAAVLHRRDRGWDARRTSTLRPRWRPLAHFDWADQSTAKSHTRLAFALRRGRGIPCRESRNAQPTHRCRFSRNRSLTRTRLFGSPPDAALTRLHNERQSVVPGSGGVPGFGYHGDSSPDPDQRCYSGSYLIEAKKVQLPRMWPLTGDWIDGLWRSLVSALDWGSRGPGFKSRQPDHVGTGQRPYSDGPFCCLGSCDHRMITSGKLHALRPAR
jgi:hypothetical protein